MELITKALLVLSVVGYSAGLKLPVQTGKADTGIVVAADNEDYRLPINVLPLRYDLTITTSFPIDGSPPTNFTGRVKITLNATEADVKTIVLHQKDLNITFIEVSSGDNLNISETLYNNITDKWTINLTTAVTQTANYNFTIDYEGLMKDDMNGFYRSHYMEGGKKVWMGATQFQQTEARRAFPCFDEPRFRSQYKLTVNRPADMKTISNTKRTGGGQTSDEFKETPIMSSYLLAFIVSKYEGNLNTNVAKPFGIYARPEAKQFTNLSLSFGQTMVDKFSDYLGIDYYTAGTGNDKMDMAAIPDFSAGAMENWGLLTYRETNILYYPSDTPSLNEQRIVAVIAHEQAHQWFGDLITCNWWSETWLNEGFARYFQYFGTKMIAGYTDWDLEEQFVVENHQQSMQLDSTDDTHPMTNPEVKTQAQASNMFDNISYNKAASVIRMLSSYIGMDNFQAVLKEYLKVNRANGSVVPQNLFDALDAVYTTEKASEMWKTWTTQSGFPLLTVKLDGQILNLSQKRFMRSGINNDKTERYNIPITFAIDSESYENTKATIVYKSTEQTKTVELPKKPSKYYILNPKQTGYYRVNYDADNWGKIKDALMKDKHDEIHVLNRAQIVDDLFNLARGGVVEYSTAIDIIRYIKKETDYIPWLSAINNGLTFLSQRVSGDEQQKTFAWFVRDTMDEIYKHLTFVPPMTERRTNIYNRVNILTWTCKYGHEDCLKNATSAFASYMNGTVVHKDQRSIVYCNGVRNGSATEFNALYDKFTKTDISAEQLNLLAGMACTKDVALVKKYLDRLINTEEIRPQDRASTINNILNANPEGADFLFNYITQNHDAWKAKMGSLGTLSTVAGRFTTAKQFEDYDKFLTEKKTLLADSYTSLKNSLDSSKKNLDWDAKYMKEFMDHITKLKNSAPINVMSVLISFISIAVLYLFN